MKKQEMIRKLFQIIAFILFCIQVQQSVKKYFQFPVVVEKSTIPVEELPSPVVYICQDDQFNHSKARRHGYEYIMNFATGTMMNNKNVTWNGKDNDVTYQDLENMLFKNDYQTILSNLSHTWQRIFLFPHGICLKLIGVSPKLLVHLRATKRVIFIVVDPYMANSIRTEQTVDAKTIIGPIDEHFEAEVNEVEYTLHDASIHDGVTCTKVKSEKSYGNCVEGLLRRRFLSVYGCLPPWVSSRKPEMICGSETNVSSEVIRKRPFYWELQQLMNNRKVDMFKNCLPPCLTLQTKLWKTRYESNFVDHAILDVKSQDWATVYTQVNSYDIFNLTVDLGSALGLWMGWSCLSILDHILAYWIYVQKYLEK
jgi:hypothetical protein